MRHRAPRGPAVLLAAAALTLLPHGAGGAGPLPPSAFPPPPGTVSTALLADASAPWSWEPGIARSSGGTLYVSGNHCFPADQSGPCLIDPGGRARPDAAPLWRSDDGGRTWHFAGDPLRLGVDVIGQPQPGGEDTDVAVAPDAAAGSQPLLAVASAWAASSAVALSGDGGAGFAVATLSGVPFQDRPWLLAQGRCDLYVEYHLLSGAENVASVPRVDRYDGCAALQAAHAGQTTVVAASSTLVEPVADQATRSAQVMAHIVASRGRIVVAHLDCDSGQPAHLDCTAPGDHQSMRVAVSDDRATTFTEVTLPDAGLHGSLNDGVWPLGAAADGGGLVAVASTDAHHVHLWTSRDDARTWRLAGLPVDAGLGWSLATVPSVAAAPGELVVAWYGSGAPEAGAQRWRLVVARSTDGGASFRLAVLDPVLATTAAGSPLVRGLYDDFGAVVQPDGSAVIVDTQSCEGHAPGDARCPGAPVGAAGTFDVVRATRLPPPVAAAGPTATPPGTSAAGSPGTAPAPNTAAAAGSAPSALAVAAATAAVLALSRGRGRHRRRPRARHTR